MPYIGRPLQAGVRRRYIYAATSGQTSFSGNDSNGISLAYDDSLFLDVYQNGVLLKPVTDYTSTTGTSVVLTTGASTDDVLEMLVFDTFGVADTVSAKDGGSFSSSVAFSGGATFPDSAELAFGASSDFKISHNGSKTKLEDTGTGNLEIRGTNIEFYSGDGGETLAKLTDDGACELYHNNTKRIETTSIGIGADQVFGLSDTDTGVALGANGSGIIQLYSDNNEVARFGPTEIAFNEGSADVDFRVESNNLSAAIMVDAGNDRLGFGISTPSRPFEFYGNDASNYIAEFEHDGNNSNRYGVIIRTGADDSSGTNYTLTIRDGDNSTQGHITFSGGTVTYGAFTAHHPCVIPNSDNDASSTENAYPYGTLLETTSISYSQKSGADTERGIRYNVQKTQSANSKAVLGAYGSSMNGGPDEETNMHQALVLGDGHILCNNAGGNIAVGDGICSSATAGIGQKATANPSMIIGIAQEAVTFSSGSETKLVAVQYGLQQFIPWS